MLFHKPTKPASAATSASHSEIVDPEFGTVTCKRTSGTYVRVRVDQHGELVATMPRRATLKHVQALLDSSRETIRSMLQQHRQTAPVYEHGMRLGHSHTLHLTVAPSKLPSHSLHQQVLRVSLPATWNTQSGEGRRYIATHVKAVLTREARAYLPRRLSYLAEQFGFDYTKVRFGNPKGRWGSCSSNGTISLNVALMNTPHDVIDYVLVHELCHTRHMNHSAAFWHSVETCIPHYRQTRRRLKQLSPVC